MCGVAGYFGDGNETILRAMTETLEHRGPDDSGCLVHENVGLGFRRLSIIDLTGGQQPLANEDETVWVVFNGEIYNFQSLRTELLARGHFFKTNSDTEVIVHLYEEMGERLCERLHGMFAFVVWDEKKQQLLLARDRIGKKPLYYYADEQSVVFGSELKALFKHPRVPKEIDPNALLLYLSYEFVPTPQSIWRGVKKLAPASVRIWSAANSATATNGARLTAREFVYWQLPFQSEKLPTAEKDLLADLDRRLQAAVIERLVADVPVGLFLSGGMDSTLVAAYAAAVTDKPLQTFTIGFSDSSYDESAAARRVAKILHTDHYEHVFSEQDLLNLLSVLSAHMDEPLADPSLLPTALLAKFTREKVTVALSGDGGDELFMGYPTFHLHAWCEKNFWLKICAPFFKKVSGYLPVGEGYLSPGFVARRFSRGVAHSLIERDLLWRGAWAPSAAYNLLTPELQEQISQNFILEERGRWDSPDDGWKKRITTEYLRHFLMDDVLVKIDRATMWAALEARAPLLAAPVVSFALSLAAQHKRGGLQGKLILRKLLATRFPGLYEHRAKHGFSIPTAKWLAGPLREMTQQAIADIGRIGLCKTEPLYAMAAQHAARQQDYRKELWTILTLGQWVKNWLV